MSAAEPAPHVAIVDGHAQFFRAYYALRGGLSSPVTGEPTGLVFGFLSTLFSYLRKERPGGLVVVIDAAGDTETFRSALYPDYKAHRDPAPEDFHPQVERCLEALRLMGVPVLAVEGVEADDVIATLVRRLRRSQPALRIRMLSRDKDLAQLVDEQVTLFDPQKGGDVGLEALFESKGVRPDQVVDLLALMGDSADNVPGVPGVGPKTAAALLAEYGSIEGIYENVARITGKRGEALAASRELVDLSRRLVTLKDDCDFAFDEVDARFDPSRCDLPQLLELLRVLGFHRLRSEAEEIFGGAARRESEAGATPAAGGSTAARKAASARTSDGGPARSKGGGPGLFDAPPEPAAATSPTSPHVRHDAATFGTLFDAVAADAGPPTSARTMEVRLVRTEAELDALVAALRAAERFAVDCETDSLVVPIARLVGLSFACREGEAWYVPVRSPEPASHLDLERVLGRLRALLEDPALGKVGHNLKYDHAVLANHGVALRGIVGDSMLASYLADPTRPSHGLDATSEHVLGVRPIPIEAVLGPKGPGQRRFDEAPLVLAAPYAAEDAELALALCARLEAGLSERGQRRAYDEIEVPLVPVLARMERAGIRVDRDELATQRRALEIRLAALRDEIAAAAPWGFNPDSPKQLAQVLFHAPDADPPGLGLRIVKRTATGPSTDSEVLEKLAEDPACSSTLPERILEYRQFAKLVGTYLKALDAAVVPETGRIHCSFHQTGTATGRLSSSEPNLQNIPVRTEVGAAIRRAFVAGEGMTFVSADYSQIELRFLAHFSEDPGLCEAFARGEDVHRAVAAQVFGVPLSEVGDVQRSAAKMVNFGIVYGITASGLARRLGPGWSIAKAKEIIESYRVRFRGIDAFLARCIDEAKCSGHATTIAGRWRPIPQIASRNPAERAFGERIAVNTVVQGSAADLIKVAMVRLDAALAERHPKARLLLQIHDELLVESPLEDAGGVSALLAEVMRGAMRLKVPLEVSSATGQRWSDV